MNKAAVCLSLALLSFCASKQKIELAPSSPELEQKIASADALRQKGCYVPLKQSFRIYEELYARPEYKKKIAAKLASTALLLAVREKELGMANKAYMDKALSAIKDNPSLSGLGPYSEIAGLFWVQGKGVMRDIDERFPGKETQDNLMAMDAELRQKARADEFFAYMYATLKCFLSTPQEDRDEPAELAAAFPASLLLKYKMATCPQENEELLREILAQEPQFYEAAYDLGNLALSRGNLLQAEGYFLQMHLGIPESPQATILLASIALALEEVERSLEYYDQTLALVPDYRDALLGRAICLSYLGRPEEAIAVCEKIIALGYWLLGESYYWMAWNQHELKDNEAAAADIEQAKGRLPTSTEVFTLSGIIAWERGDAAKAEKDFKEALQYNPTNSEALFNLGSLYAQKQEWKNSGVFFEKAGFAFENQEQSLKNKIAQVEKSTLSPDRREVLLQKKKNQVEKVLLSKATSFYDAAAGYLNSGQKYRALEMAARASDHPAFKQRADALISQIK